jgi:hypothetical protein
MLPAQHPAEVLALDPEGLEVANCYLQTQNLVKTAEELGVSTELVASQLNRREVKVYIDGVFRDMGFNNRFKMRRAMDTLISKKFQELDEAGVGSSKDIADLLALSHKMTMEQLDREIALEKVRGSNIKSQVNVQINDGGAGSNYGSLLDKLLKGG